MRARRKALVGILNGIDVEVWNPRTDPYLPAPFDADDLSGKTAAKRALLDCFGLSTDEVTMARPIAGMVSRMVDQKGFDLLEAAAPALLSLDATYLIVGSGDPRYQDFWRQLADARPDRVGAFIGFDERRAHLVEAGSDLFLMPSRFEPCGLNQMYSLRYGTVPVVRAVGGLVDTVRPFSSRTGQGTGFLFADYHPDALLDAVQGALAVWENPRAWRRLQRNGMRKDFSWERSAAEYVKMYKRVMAAKKNAARVVTG
jgi:starch synthase